MPEPIYGESSSTPSYTSSYSGSNNSGSSNNWSGNDWAGEFAGTGVTVPYVAHAGSSVNNLPSNVPWSGPTGPSTPGSGNNMAADFFGTTTVINAPGHPSHGATIPIGNLGDVYGNNYENEFIGDLINYGEFGYGPGPQWDDELTEFFGGKPPGGFSHANLTEYLYGIGAAGIDDSMFLGGNPGQTGYGPGVKPEWYGQPRPSTNIGGGPSPGGGGYGWGSGGGGGSRGSGGGSRMQFPGAEGAGGMRGRWGQSTIQGDYIRRMRGYNRGGIVSLC